MRPCWWKSLLLVQAASLFLSSAPADQGADQYLFGNWEGARAQLAEHGIQPTFLILVDPFGNATGGRRQGFTSYNLIDLNLVFDTEKMGGWRGGHFTVGGSIDFGTDLTAHYIGNNFFVQLTGGQPLGPRLNYLSYTQSFAEGKINLLVGRLTINTVHGEEFLASAYYKLFTNVGISSIPQGVFLNAPGAYGFPVATWGARIKYSPTSRIYLQAGVYNGDHKQGEAAHHGIDFSVRGPLFTIGEAGFRWNYGERQTGLARNIKMGGYYDAATYRTPVTSGSQAVGNASGLYGLYVLGDQQLWRWRDNRYRKPARPENARLGDSERDRHLGVFGTFLAAPQRRINTVPYFMDAGLVAYGPAASRPDDFAAFGVVYGSYQNGPPSISALIVPPNNEQTWELTYGFTLRPGLLLQPDLQYIVHPKGSVSIPSTLPADRGVPNAFAAGINIVIHP